MKGLICQETKIVQKVIHKEGEAYLASFLVVNSGGNISWKIIYIAPIEKTAPEILLLEPKDQTENTPEIKTHFDGIISPYFDLLFFISQPTRAPNF